MSALTDRIFGLHKASPANPGEVPILPSDGKDYRAARVIPLVRIQTQHSGIITYDEPLITADGAMVPATAPGQWGQLYAVGRY